MKRRYFDTMDEYTECPECRKPTPSENLNCIYCGEALPQPVGVLSGLRYSLKGWFALVVAFVALVAFLLLVLR